MKKLVPVLLIVFAAVLALGEYAPTAISPSATAQTSDALTAAIAQQKSDVQVRGQGEVVKVLADDNEGSRHQKFILALDSGQTLLIAHNIDLAPRIQNLRKGDVVGFYGEYEWNPRGGVVHWTHRDPGGRHLDGWLKHKGKTLQ